MKSAAVTRATVSDRGIRVEIEVKMGQVVLARTALIRWNDLDVSEVADALDRAARRALMEAWSGEPLPLWPES